MKLDTQWEPVPNQKFEIGRTINPFKCDCTDCDFLHCPKKNYAVRYKVKGYKVQDFWDAYKDDIVELNRKNVLDVDFANDYNFQLTWDLITDLMEAVAFTFPKNTYWDTTDSLWEDRDKEIGDTRYQTIRLVKFNRAGSEVELGRITIANHKILEIDMTNAQYKLAEKIRDVLLWLKQQTYIQVEKDYEDTLPNIGWLDREGRLYKCKHGEHSKLAEKLIGGELAAESFGWIKIILEEEEDGYLHTCRLSPEQKNWLSLNGYVVED